MSYANFFERVFVINLDRRADRWTTFTDRQPSDWPFRMPQRIAAVDGRMVKPPNWWRAGSAAWGCYRSHVRLLETCLQDGIETVLILEDDAIFCDAFADKAQTFLSHVPPDWEMLYFGGQHLNVHQQPPRRISAWVYQPHNVNRTHAYAVRGPTFMRVLYQHLHNWSLWNSGHHLDHHLGRLHETGKHRIYAPKEWLVGQAPGSSDISGREAQQHYWPAAEIVASTRTDPLRFVVVLGLHCSGSSAMAGVLHHLGLHLGNKLGGYYGSDPERSCGYEAVGLAKICEAAIPFPSRSVKCSHQELVARLRQWINSRQREAINKGTLAGCKYPMLCRLGAPLLEIVGQRLHVLHIDRPIDESIASLIRRCPRRDARQLAAHQRWLDRGKREFLANVSADRILCVPYPQLLAEPSATAAEVTRFLGITASAAQITRAVASVDPARRHVNSQKFIA